MELITLDENFQPAELIENYTSLIWTERYSTNGDFEIQSNDINALVSALPLESVVSLRESGVPMVVEAHKITKPLRDIPVVSITGRSFETVLERRGSVNALPASSSRASWTISAAKASDAAFIAMRTVLGDSAQYNSSGTQVAPAVNPAVSPLDAIPEIQLVLPLDFVAPASAPSTTNFEIEPKDLYSSVADLIATNHRGIKAFRPAAGDTFIGIEIYNGADLTEDYVIDVRFDQIDEANYLLSFQASTNVGYIYGSGMSRKVLKTTSDEPAGLARRVLVLDASSDDTANSSDILTTRGLIELYKNNVTSLFDGSVAQQVASGYNKDYFLGDILKLTGEYGITENVRVTEFIRSSDNSGDSAYPTFEAIVDE